MAKLKIEEIKEEIESLLEKYEFEAATGLKDKFRQELANVKDPDILRTHTNYIDDFDSRVKKAKEVKRLKDRIDKGLQVIMTYTEANQFQQAIEDIDKWIDLARRNWLDVYLAKLEKIKDDILKGKWDFDRDSDLIERLENLVENAEEKKNWAVAIQNCEILIRTARKIKKKELLEKYESRLADITKKRDYLKEQEEKERQLLLKQAQEAEKIIEKEKGVLPFVEDYSINDLLGNLSDNVNDMMNQLSSLLDEHRVEIKQDIKSTNTMRSVTGEVAIIEKVTNIVQKEAESTKPGSKAVKPSSFAVNSTLENPFNDMIDEAIIQDLIPYNYQITELKLNGETPTSEPETIEGRDGLEVKWTLHNIQPKQKISIDYDLRRRVSRTIILPLAEQLKIIKTHSNLNPLEPEGLYNAKLKFANRFDQSVKGVVIEDIVPTDFVYDIKEPQEVPESKLEQVNGSLVKWLVNNVPKNYSNTYAYQLLEIYKFEQLKIEANILAKKALEDLEKDQVPPSMDKYNQIIKILTEYK